MDSILDTAGMLLEAYREEIGWGLLAISAIAAIWLVRWWWNRRRDEVVIAAEKASSRCAHGVHNRGSGCRKCARDFAEQVAAERPNTKWRWCVECLACHGIFDDVTQLGCHKCKPTTLTYLDWQFANDETSADL